MSRQHGDDPLVGPDCPLSTKGPDTSNGRSARCLAADSRAVDDLLGSKDFVVADGRDDPVGELNCVHRTVP
ncbi:hypothetical protein D3C83_191520 [compost metagenome]